MRKPGTGETYDKFRDLLIRARRAAGLKQVELAERMNRSQAFVTRYETGERRLDVVEFLEVVSALGIDAHRILDDLIETIETPEQK